MLAQKIFRLDPGKAQHFRNLVESQSLVAIALQGESFHGAARNIPTGGKPLSNVIGDAEGDFHRSEFNTPGVVWHWPGDRYVAARTLLGAASTVLGIVLLAYPALAGWANFWRAYGAREKEDGPYMRRRKPRTDLKVGHYIRRIRAGREPGRSRDTCIGPCDRNEGRRGRQDKRGKRAGRPD